MDWVNFFLNWIWIIIGVAVIIWGIFTYAGTGYLKTCGIIMILVFVFSLASLELEEIIHSALDLKAESSEMLSRAILLLCAIAVYFYFKPKKN